MVLLCAAASGVTYKWASSSHRIYVMGPGAVMLSDIKAALPKSQLTQVAPGVWHLRANLILQTNATLLLHGTVIGGDCNELRIKSNNDSEVNSAGLAINYVNITADWGNIDMRNTTVTSWDDAIQGPDMECDQYHRAFIRVRSSMVSGIKHESRMDIIDSDVGYLGCHEAEAYGLTWKVTGPTNNLNILEVYGDIMRSHIHNNFFGVYTWGHQGGRWIDNEVDNNIWYGFDPHDDSDNLIIANNNIHHNGTHGIIGSQRCNNLTVRNNLSWNNGGVGIMYHRYTDEGLIENNHCLHNGDAGIAIFDSYRNTIRNNTLWNNFKSGIRLSVGSADNLVVSNDFGYGGNFGLYLYKGNDAPRPGDDGRPKRNLFLGNVVHDNSGNGLYLTGSDLNIFAGNIFKDNYGPLWFIKGRGNVFESNSLPSSVLVRNQGTPYNASTTVIRNQPEVSIQVDSYSSTTFEDPYGRVFEPEEGELPNTLRVSGTSLTLTTAEIGKTSKVAMRNLYAQPDAGLGLIAISFWNTSGDLSKRWTLQAGSSTRVITYRVGDLAPGRMYSIIKKGSSTRLAADELGYLTFQDRAVTTGLTDYLIRP